jgi:hypothetical protein
MPMYSWRCLTCEEKRDVLRDVDKREHPPKDEGETPECAKADTKTHAWVRVIHPPRVAKGAGWGPGKGYWMLAFLLGGLLSLLAPRAEAKELRLLDADRLDLEYARMVPETRDPYSPQHTGEWRDRIALEWDVTLLQWGYWNNWVHTETTSPSGRVTTVGWQFEAGFHLTDYFDLYRSHHSRHVMEEEAEHRFEDSHAQFPVEDTYGIRFHLYGRT